MFGSRGHEQEVACFERISLAVMKQDAAAAEDDVDLGAVVRGRWPWERGEAAEGAHRLQGAVLQHAHRVLAGGAGDARLSLGKTDHTAASGRAHPSPLAPPNHAAHRRGASAAKTRSRPS